MKGARLARKSHRTRALLLRRVEHGESDLIVWLFTEELGRLSALARGARRSQRRFGGMLEPFQTLVVELDEPAGGGELFTLREATLDVSRIGLTASLDAMDAAGRALSWVRTAAPPRTPEPAVWTALQVLLDRLDASPRVNPRLVLAEQGLVLLSAFGWGLDLERCVRCGRPCEPDRAALIDPIRGGLVCRACGGAKTRLSGPLRARLAEGSLEPGDVDVALELVERALQAHAGMA